NIATPTPKISTPYLHDALPIFTGTSTDTNTFAGQIVNGTGGVTSLTKSGTGKWILTHPSNTYSGNTTVSGGTLVLNTPISSSPRSEEHTSELQSLRHLVCRLLL